MTDGGILSVVADLSRTAREIVGKCRMAQAMLTITALDDCNRYCKVDSGALKNSAKGDLRTGLLSWNTPYARKAYYTGRPDRSKNPYASLMWAHKAARLHFKKWEDLVRKELL